MSSIERLFRKRLCPPAPNLVADFATTWSEFRRGRLAVNPMVRLAWSLRLKVCLRLPIARAQNLPKQSRHALNYDSLNSPSTFLARFVMSPLVPQIYRIL